MTIKILITFSLLLLISCEKNKTIESKAPLVYEEYIQLIKTQKGRESLSLYFANGRINVEDYVNWSYDYGTRFPDGLENNEKLNELVFQKALKDQQYCNNVAVFFAPFLDGLKAEEHPGAQKIVTSIQLSK